jgi:cellulose synthase (UDP-forming)
LNGGNPLHALDLNPLTMYLRFSPDFDYGPDKDMYLHLVYSNDANALDPRSSLTARLNGAAAESAPVRAGSTAMAPQEMNVSLGALPASDFANTLQMQFHFIQPVAQGCGNAAHVSGSIGKDSYLDVGSPVHLAQLPDLHLFSVAGFPYTRMADLSDSVILLPRDASNAELTLYLDLLSYFGMQTGYPALRVQVNDPSNAAQFQNKNLLMIGDYNNLGAIPSIASDLPLSIRSDGWKLTPRARLVGAIDDWFNQLSGATSSDPAWQDGSSAEGVIEQIESPYSRDHSALVILGRDSSSLEAMTAGLMAELPHNGITGTVSLWHGGSFVSHKFSTPSYFLGDAGMFSRFKIILPRYLWVLFPGMVIVLMLLSLWLDACIKRRVRARLMGVEFDLDGNANATLP